MSTKNQDPGGGVSRHLKSTESARVNPIARPPRDRRSLTLDPDEESSPTGEVMEMDRPVMPKQNLQHAQQPTTTPSRTRMYISPEAAIDRIRTALTDISSTLTKVDTNEFRDEDAFDQSMKTTIIDLYSRFIEKDDEMENAVGMDNSHAKLINANIKLIDTIAALTEANLNLTKQIQVSRIAPAMPASDPLSQTTLSDTMKGNKGLKIIKSANPIPIKPTVTPRKSLVERTPTGPAERNHPSRLIVETYPLIPINRRRMGPEVVARVNESIHHRGAKESIKIMAIMYSMTGNVVAIAAPGCQGADLMGYEEAIVEAIDPDFHPDLTTSHVDTQRFKVKLDRIPTHNAHGTRTTTQELEQAITWSFKAFEDMKQAAPPAWLGPEAELAKQRTASVVFSFANVDDALLFKKQRTIFVLGMPCTTAAYEERPRPIYCGYCGSLSHREMSCKGECCQICTSVDHQTTEHPEDMKPKCINCGQEHSARSRDCDRLAKILGRPSVTQSRPAGGAAPVNGTRRKTRKATKEPPANLTSPPASQGSHANGTQALDDAMLDTGDGVHAPGPRRDARTKAQWGTPHPGDLGAEAYAANADLFSIAPFQSPSTTTRRPTPSASN